MDPSPPALPKFSQVHLTLPSGPLSCGITDEHDSTHFAVDDYEVLVDHGNEWCAFKQSSEFVRIDAAPLVILVRV